MSETSSVFLITIALIALGYLIKRLNFVSEIDGKVISKFLMHSTFPALMLLSTARVKIVPSLFLIPFIAIVVGFMMLAVAWIWFKKYPNNTRGVLMMSLGAYNTGLFAFPIIEGIWGREGMVYAIMFDIGVTIMVFFVLYPLGSFFAIRGKEKIHFKPIFKKILTLVPLWGMIVGLIINFLSIELPVIALDFLEILAKANKPIVLLLMGIYLSFSLEKHQFMAIGKSLLVRYIVGFIAIAIFMYLIPEPSLFRSIMIISVILPAGMTLLTFSDEFGFDHKLPAAIVNSTLLISFGLMWFLVWLLELG